MSSVVLHAAVGLGFTTLLGFGIGPFMKRVGKSLAVPEPSNASDKVKEQWKELMKENKGGAILGWMERFIFFAIFLLGPVAYTAIAGWLAFIVACKWQVWSKIISVPNELRGSVNDIDLDMLIVRRRWGSRLLMTFQIGIAYNIIAGMLGAMVTKHWDDIGQFIGY